MMEVSHSMEEPDGNSVVKRLSVPIGLEELMTSLTKEVLKKKPIDIYNFASDHFSQLLSLREDGNYPEPTAKIITYINNVDFKTGNKNEKQLKDKQLARQVSLNVQPFIQNFKIVGKKSELKSDKRNKKEEVVKHKNEKLKVNKKKCLSKLDQEKSLQNDNKNKSKDSNGEVNKKSKKILDKTLPSKGKTTKIKKRVKSVDNFTSFSNFTKNHNIIDPEDIQINSLDEDNISLSSENINAKNYDPLVLRKDLIKIQDESKFTSFTTTYNPYKLRQEIKSVSLDETATKNDELERKFLKDDVGVSNNETVNIEVENVEKNDCSINESDKAKDVILDKNSNIHEESVIEKEEIENLEANGAISTADDKIEENIKEVLSQDDNLNEPSKTSNDEKTYNASKIFASAGLAAIKIQSMWRGFKTRKSFPVVNNNNSNLENNDETSSKFSGLDNEMILNAATKIQAGVRGYLSRKQNKKVVDVIKDENQNDELKNKDELKKEMQNVISNNKSEFSDNLIESNENIQEVSLVDDKSLKEDESILSEMKDAAANNEDIAEIEIVNKETTDGLDQSTEPASLQKVTESNTETVIKNEESNSISNEINATPINIQNIESEVKEEISKTIENVPIFEETTINENIIDKIIPAELNENSQITENIEKNLIIEENVNSKDSELKSMASEIDEINLPSTATEPNLKSDNNDNVNDAEEGKELESTVTENELTKDNIKNSVHEENESANSIENIDKEIILDIKDVSDNNNTGSPELVAIINDENFVNENDNNEQGVREKRSVNFQEIIEEENNKLIDSLNNSKNIAINKEPKISEINKEIETSTNEHLHVVMQSEVIDGTEDKNNEEFQNDSKSEQQSIETNLSVGSILQHSGELHDTPTYFNEESKQSSDSISKNVEKEDRKSLLNLEHSGELHDLVIVEKNNNSKNETVQSEENNINSIEYKLQEEENKDRKKSKNIIEDSKVENFEENYEIITKDTSGLYDIEELIESDDKLLVNPEDGNVVSQLTEVNIDRKEFDKEPESEVKEQRSLDEKAESDVSLQPNEENIKSDDITELHEMEKSKEPEDDLIKSENKILQQTELPDASVQGVDVQVHIEDVKLQPFDEETVETEKIIEVDDGTSKINEVTKKEEVKSEAKNFDITKLRAELNEANIISKEDTELVMSLENKESSETNKIEEKGNVEGIEELNKFDITKLRTELEEAENISTNGTDIGTPTNGKDSVEENKNVIEPEKHEKEITEIEVTKLGDGLDVEEKISKNISIDETTVADNGSTHEDIIKIEENTVAKENVEIENSENNITEKEEKASIEENIENKKDTVKDITNGKDETAEIEEGAEVEKNITKVDVTKLGAVEDIIKDIKIDSSTEDTGSSEINVAEKDENAESEENVEISSETKQFDITKLRAELEEVENISTKSTNFDTDIVEKIKNDKEKNGKIKEGTEVEEEIEKSTVTNLSAGLAVTEEINKDTIIDESTKDTENFEKTIIEEEKIGTIEEKAEAENAAKKFDITKLRAELEEVENINTESKNPDTSTNGKDVVGEIKTEKKDPAESEKSTEVETESKKSEVTKLDAGLAVTEKITKETIIEESTEKTESSEKTISEEEKIDTTEKNIKGENTANKFDITKLRAELDEAENINSKNTNLDTSINGIDIGDKIIDDKKENAETETSTEDEKEIQKSEITKLGAGLATTEETTIDTIIDEATKDTENSVMIITEEEKIGTFEEKVEADNASKKFDITKLRAELEEVENINLDTSTNGKDIVGEIEADKKEPAESEESIEVETEIKKSEETKLDAGLAVTEKTIIDESTKNTESSEKNITEEKEKGTIEENVEAEIAAKKFDITKLRAELDEVENINTECTNLDTSINGIDIGDKIKDDKKENAETEKSTKVEKEIPKSEVTKLGAELAVTEEITKDTIIDESTKDTENSEKTVIEEKKIGTIEQNVETENATKKFDITKLRAELNEAENINTESANLDTSINEKGIVGEIENDKKENSETEESTEVQKEIEKIEATKLDPGLAAPKEITQDSSILVDESMEDTGNSKISVTEEEEIDKTEKNSKAETTANKFDITKLRAELDEVENINSKNTNLDTSINEKDIVGEINNDKKENTEITESAEVEKEIEKTEVTKLDSGLVITKELIKDTNIDESTGDIGSSEEKMTKKEENIAVPSEAKQFDITENINTEITNLDTPENGKVIVENIKNSKEENAITEENAEVEREIKKTESSKLNTGLAVTKEKIIDTNINASTEGTGNSDENIIEKGEDDKYEENVEVPKEAKQLDITKLPSELDESENINTKIANLDTPTNGKDIVENIENGKEENAEIEKCAEVEKQIEKAEVTKLNTGIAVTEEIMTDTNINAATEGTGNSEEKFIEKKEDDKNEENVEASCETKKFDITKLRSELEEADNISQKPKDVVEEVKNGKEENVEIEKSAEVEKEIEKTKGTKLDAGLAVAEETINDSSVDVSSEGYGSFEKDEKVKIEENVEVPCESNKFDLTKLRAELDNVELLSAEDKNSTLELNNNEIKEETPTVSQLNEKDSDESDEKVEENTKTNKFDLSKLRAELHDIEESKEDHNLIVNTDKTEEDAAVENTKNEKANKFDLSKLRAELSKVDSVVIPTDEKELDDNDKSVPEIKNIENESHSAKEINSTSQLHLIDNEYNNDAIKSNTTNDVDHQLTVINNDIQDVNKNIKNENTLQLEPLHTTHSISGKEFEFIPTESSDNLIISSNDSNQSFSNKEVEPKINKEVMTNTNQESNFNSILLNNETNSANRQDDMTDERAQSGISASPDSDVTVIFNTNSSNKLDDNLVP